MNQSPRVQNFPLWGCHALRQAKIGEEVTHALLKLVNQGSTINSVNFPNVELPFHAGCHRILNIHVNKAGVLRVRLKGSRTFLILILHALLLANLNR